MLAREFGRLTQLGHDNRRPLCWIRALCPVMVLLLTPFRAFGAEVWLSGFDPVIWSVVQPGVASDYFDLFTPDAAWPRAAAGVRVFKIGGSLAGRGPEAQLRRMFADLKRRHISLALELSALTAMSDCGQHIEGYAGPRESAHLAERIRQLGGDLQYVAMDEPLWNGHEFSGLNACHTAISEIAADVTANVRAIRRVFPAVQVGDIEQIGRAAPSDLVDQIMQWTGAYHEAAGEPLAFLHFDVVWTGPWRQQLALLVPRLHAAGIKFGIIYNGDPDEPTDLAWTDHAEQRFVSIEATPALVPDQAILQTWMLHPSRMLPETRSGTMTWLVDRYLAAPTRVTLRRAGGGLQGELTDAVGRPLTAVPVTVLAELAGEADAPAQHSRSGQVPSKAVTALFALRINTECGCTGTADIGTGPMRYKDNRTGQTVQQAFRPLSAPGGIAGLARFRAQPGQAVMQNTPGFPVTADDPFTIQVPMRTDPASAGSGYVALIFLDAQGKEVVRLPLLFEPVERPIGAPTTDAQGRFSVVPDPEILRRASGFRVEFAGTAQYRMAETGVH